jgi:hypothetical protein
MPLRIAFDLDGVLADMESELIRQAATLFGDEITRQLQEPAKPQETNAGAATAEPSSEKTPSAPEKTPTTPEERPVAPEDAVDNVSPLLKLNLSHRQQRRLWRHVESIENFWGGLKELEPGIIERLWKVAIERRWEIIFLTKRPDTAGATAQVQSQRWLEAKGFLLPSVYVVQRSRGRIAAALALDVVIDDLPENCLDVVVDSKARAILVSRDDRQVPGAARRLGIGVVKSVAECLEILAAIDDAAQQEPSMMTRVMRMLGLKEPANA